MISYHLSKLRAPIPVKKGVFMLLLFWSTVYSVAIFQDFIEAKLASTGFYWSETMLYNTYWLWFIPLIHLLRIFYKRSRPSNNLTGLLLRILSGIVFCSLHLVLFTALFVLISHALFSPSHRFLTIFESALSHHFYITAIAYLFVPLLFDYPLIAKGSRKKNLEKSISVRRGKRRIRIALESIQVITANRPYSEISVDDQRYLHDWSLKKIESLSSNLFIRVHRSALVNKVHVVELSSRKNGDYDAVLTNGQTIRFSRHSRCNWGELLSTEP